MRRKGRKEEERTKNAHGLIRWGGRMPAAATIQRAKQLFETVVVVVEEEKVSM